MTRAHAPMNHVIHKCDSAHVMLCTGTRNGYRNWKMIAVLDLPHYLACVEKVANTTV